MVPYLLAAELSVLDSVFRGNQGMLIQLFRESSMTLMFWAEYGTELASRSPGHYMTKDAFLQFFNVPGILGERLFRVFDR